MKTFIVLVSKFWQLLKKEWNAETKPTSPISSATNSKPLKLDFPDIPGWTDDGLVKFYNDGKNSWGETKKNISALGLPASDAFNTWALSEYSFRPEDLRVDSLNFKILRLVSVFLTTVTFETDVLNKQQNFIVAVIKHKADSNGIAEEKAANEVVKDLFIKFLKDHNFSDHFDIADISLEQVLIMRDENEDDKYAKAVFVKDKKLKLKVSEVFLKSVEKVFINRYWEKHL